MLQCYTIEKNFHFSSLSISLENTNTNIRAFNIFHVDFHSFLESKMNMINKRELFSSNFNLDIFTKKCQIFEKTGFIGIVGKVFISDKI